MYNNVFCLAYAYCAKLCVCSLQCGMPLLTKLQATMLMSLKKAATTEMMKTGVAEEWQISQRETADQVASSTVRWESVSTRRRCLQHRATPTIYITRSRVPHRGKPPTPMCVNNMYDVILLS